MSAEGAPEEERLQQNDSLPRKEQAQIARRKLIDAARKLFAQEGYAGTSVRQLHRAAGLADGSLYHYFPGGKQELFHAIIEEELNQIVSDTANREMDYSGQKLEQVLEEIYQIWQGLLDGHYEIFRIMFCEHEVRDVVRADELSRILAERQRWLPQLLRERAEEGEIGELDYEAVSEMIFAVMFDAMIVKVSNMKSGWMDSPEYRAAFFQGLVAAWRAS